MKGYNSQFLNISVNKTSQCVNLIMFSPIISTDSLPHTKRVLLENLPTIMTSECFNSENLPFYKEVEKTELGHLFEHMLLEYLCEEKINEGIKQVSFEGHTDWNWTLQPPGTYEISINYNYKGLDCFEVAILKTINLFNKIIEINLDNDATGSVDCRP